MFPEDVIETAREVLAGARSLKLRIATAESCTGGLIASALTEIAGSSDVFDRGFVTYSNEAKTAILDVPAALLVRHGAVSGEAAEAMARGALLRSAAGIVVSVTGIAGPGGGSAEKPVGLVYLASARRGEDPVAIERRFEGLDRAQIRLESVRVALSLLKGLAGPPSAA